MMKRKSSSSEEEKVATLELGLKLQEKNQDRPFSSDNHDNHDDDGGGGGGPTFKGYKYNNNNNNNNISNVVGGGGDVCESATVDVVRNLQCFDVPSSYYYPSFAPTNPFYKPTSGGMATAAMGFPFTAAQWKELERQAMIYKYMMASLPVPPDLLYSSFTTNFLPSSAFTPASYFMGKYGSGLSVRWSGNSKDAEPGRCRRTDGKKWRCSRDVAPNSKYCERHMHRGRPRSRKHVEHQLLQHDNQPQSLSNLPINNNDVSNKAKDNVSKKSRLNDQSVGSRSVQPSKGPVFDQSVVSNANPFEDSRNLVWSDEQQWHHLMQTNMNSSVFHHQLEGETLNMNSTGGLISKTDMGLSERPLFDAWSMGVTETKDNAENNHKFPNSSLNFTQGNAVNEEMCQIHMGLGLIDSWVASSTTPGGPLAEVLRPGIAREGDFVTPPATAVSSPSGVLQKTLATFSDSSGSNSPVCHNSNITSDMPFNWLN
ncbi:hypothetical protein RND81_05G104400 [Saponaria officinalis]|uniref:Growth-regulating factor n=1 Tax=Saponaria officinalis TaxID=3572 RepID=A0AAW1KWY1_SAPOF